jgi:hypothetical protein
LHQIHPITAFGLRYHKTRTTATYAVIFDRSDRDFYRFRGQTMAVPVKELIEKCVIPVRIFAVWAPD